MKSFITVFLLILAGTALGQMTEEWVARYNGTAGYSESAYDIAADNQGNVYITGTSSGVGTGDDYTTIKYNSDGDTVWTARYYGVSGYNTDEAHALAVDNEGNVYVTGKSKIPATDFDAATIKYDSSGSVIWVVRYNGPGNAHDDASDLALDDDGNVYITGFSFDGSTDYDYVTIKYDSEGNQLWASRYDSPTHAEDFAFDLAIDDEGNVYVTGKSEGSGNSDYDYVTIKYNSEGVQLWASRYNGTGNGVENAKKLAVDNEGNVYVTGYSWGGSSANYDFATIKYNSLGNQIWVSRYNGTSSEGDFAYDLVIDEMNNVYVTGYTCNTGTGADLAVIKYNSGGSQQWVACYNGPANDSDFGQALALDAAGNIFITGYSVGVTSDCDYVIIEYDSNGDSVWAAHYNGPGNGVDMAKAITVDNTGNVYITGNSYDSVTYYDYTTIKYSPPTAIEPVRSDGALPEVCWLTCYPNPFNASTTIKYNLPKTTDMTIGIYNILGRKLETLYKGNQQAGSHSIIWNANGFSSGIYFYKLTAGQYSKTQKMILLK